MQLPGCDLEVWGMATRWWLLAISNGTWSGTDRHNAASVRTTNFVVEAQAQDLAQEFGKLAEHFRKQKAMEWLGQEMPIAGRRLVRCGST